MCGILGILFNDKESFSYNIFDNYLKKRSIRGTILIADEGINGSLSSSSQNIIKCIAFETWLGFDYEWLDPILILSFGHLTNLPYV